MGELPRTLRVEEFPSGAVYGYVLPNLERQMKAGMFPGLLKDVVRKALSGTLVEKDDEGKVLPKDQSDEDLDIWNEFTGRLVAWMVRTEGGEITYGDQDGRDMLAGRPRPIESAEVGEPVTYTWEQVLDPDVFAQDDLEAIFQRGLTRSGAPRAVASAPLGEEEEGDLGGLALFLRSPSALVYAATCERWGVVPGALFTDEAEAWHVRVGLHVRLASEEQKAQPKPDKAAEHMSRTQQAFKSAPGGGWM